MWNTCSGYERFSSFLLMGEDHGRVKYTTFYLVLSVDDSALLPTQWLSNWRLCPQKCGTDRGEEEEDPTASLCSPAWECWMLPCLAPLQILVPGSLARSSLQQESLNVVLGLCWFILSVGHLLLPPDFLPSVIHPLINLLACHMVSTCQMMITKKIGQSWPTPKVREEWCRTTEEYAPTESSYVRYCVGSAFLNPQFFTLLSFLLIPHILE